MCACAAESKRRHPHRGCSEPGTRIQRTGRGRCKQLTGKLGQECFVQNKNIGLPKLSIRRRGGRGCNRHATGCCQRTGTSQSQGFPQDAAQGRSRRSDQSRHHRLTVDAQNAQKASPAQHQTGQQTAKAMEPKVENPAARRACEVGRGCYRHLNCLKRSRPRRDGEPMMMQERAEGAN